MLLTSIDADGTRAGYDLELTARSRDGSRGARRRLGRRGGGSAPRRCLRRRCRGSARRVDRARAARALPRAEGRAEGGGMEPPQLTPAIVQDADSGRVLMLAWMDEEALRLTRETGRPGSGAARAAALAQGRDVGQHARGRGAPRRLRRRRDLVRVARTGPSATPERARASRPGSGGGSRSVPASGPTGSYVVSLLERRRRSPRERSGRRASRRHSPAPPSPTSGWSRSSPTSGSTRYALLAARGLEPQQVEAELAAALPARPPGESARGRSRGRRRSRPSRPSSRSGPC